MTPHSMVGRFRSRAPALGGVAGCGAVLWLLVAGCQAPNASAAKPNFGPPMMDVRTEAKMVEIENQYIAEKNSQPTRQHEAEAKAAKKKKEKEQQAQQAREQKAREKKSPEAAK